MSPLSRWSVPASLIFTLLLGKIATGGGFTGVVDFSSVNCGPCQQMAPIVARLEREGLPIKGVSIDGGNGLAEKYNVTRIPAFVLFVDGKEIDRHVGSMTEADLRRFVARVPQTRPAAQPDSPVPVNLGDAATLPRPQPQPLQQAPQAKVAENGSRLGGLWPFGKKEPAPPTVRGNDAELGQPPSISNVSLTDTSAAPAASASSDPMSASTRIRVFIGDHINLGSGTVIGSRPGNTLIVTCGHIFRGLRQDSKIEVDLFDGQQSKLYVARLEKYDLEADVGLIAIPTSDGVPVAQVAGRDGLPTIGQPVACIGCSGGELPTRDQLRVTAVDKYEGPNNIECTGVPVQGRSGGGLFDTKGQLVGVCIAADPKEQRGIYAGLFAVHALLDECSLQQLYQPASPSPPVLASSEPSPAEGSLSPAAEETTPGASAQPDWANEREPAASPALVQNTPPGAPAPAATSVPSLSVDAGGAEVVIIIRDRNGPDAPNKVVIIHEASPKFMAYLNGELDGGANRPPMLSDRSARSTKSLPDTRGVRDADASATADNSMPLARLDRSLRTSGHSLSAPLPVVERRTKAELAPTSLSTARARPYVRSAASR